MHGLSHVGGHEADELSHELLHGLNARLVELEVASLGVEECELHELLYFLVRDQVVSVVHGKEVSDFFIANS